MKVTITIDCGNAAFEDNGVGYELARILRAIANKVEGSSDNLVAMAAGPLQDFNGNTVGKMEVSA